MRPLSVSISPGQSQTRVSDSWQVPESYTPRWADAEDEPTTVSPHGDREDGED